MQNSHYPKKKIIQNNIQQNYGLKQLNFWYKTYQIKNRYKDKVIIHQYNTATSNYFFALNVSIF